MHDMFVKWGLCLKSMRSTLFIHKSRLGHGTTTGGIVVVENDGGSPVSRRQASRRESFRTPLPDHCKKFDFTVAVI